MYRLRREPSIHTIESGTTPYPALHLRTTISRDNKSNNGRKCPTGGEGRPRSIVHATQRTRKGEHNKETGKAAAAAADASVWWYTETVDGREQGRRGRGCAPEYSNTTGSGFYKGESVRQPSAPRTAAGRTDAEVRPNRSGTSRMSSSSSYIIVSSSTASRLLVCAFYSFRGRIAGVSFDSLTLSRSPERASANAKERGQGPARAIPDQRSQHSPPRTPPHPGAPGCTRRRPP